MRPFSMVMPSEFMAKLRTGLLRRTYEHERRFAEKAAKKLGSQGPAADAKRRNWPLPSKDTPVCTTWGPLPVVPRAVPPSRKPEGGSGGTASILVMDNGAEGQPPTRAGGSVANLLGTGAYGSTGSLNGGGNNAGGNGGGGNASGAGGAGKNLHSNKSSSALMYSVKLASVDEAYQDPEQKALAESRKSLLENAKSIADREMAKLAALRTQGATAGRRRAGSRRGSTAAGPQRRRSSAQSSDAPSADDLASAAASLSIVKEEGSGDLIVASRRRNRPPPGSHNK
jgi:hypothetical protein